MQRTKSSGGCQGDSPRTSSVKDLDSTSSSSYFIEGPWEHRNRRFQNVLLHVCSFILILEFAERVSTMALIKA